MAKEDVNIKVSANVAEAIQLWKAMEAGPDGMAKALSSMGDKGSKSIKGMEAEYSAFIGKWTSAAVVIGGVTAALRAMHEESKKRADELTQSLGSFGELQQVSASPQEFAANVARARGIVGKGITTDDNLAANMVFAMKSAGYTEQEKDFIELLGERKFVKPEGLMGLAEGLQKYRNVFGTKDAGTLPEITDKVIQAAGTAQASVPETLKALLEVAPSATQLGMTDEQTGAGFLAIEAVSPNSELAATKYRSLLDQLNKKGLWRGSLPASLADIQRRVGAGRSAFGILEEGRAVQGYENLINSQAFMEQQQGLLESAPKRKLFESQSSLLQTDPILRATAEKDRALGSYKAAHTLAVGEGEQLFQAFSAQVDKANIDQYGSIMGGLMNYSRAGADYVSSPFGGHDFVLSRMTPSQRNSLSPELQRNIEEYLNRPAGQQTIRILGPDGLDIPHEPAAADLGQ